MEEDMYEKKILDAIQMLVDNAIDKANFDKTVKGIISKCVDEKNGKYVVIYQDSSFYAYSNDTSQIYSAGTPVYVLIPKNDMTQTKTIVGSVNKLGSDYINTIESVDKYDLIGNTIASISTEQGVCSYKSGGDALILYNKNDVSSIANIDITAANTYIKQSEYLIFGGRFRTALEKEQRYKGIYGLGFDLNFKDNMTDEIVKRTYLIDVNNMLGNPYEYTKSSEQKIAFNIDGDNFIDIDKIYLFCYDFPNISDNSKPDDIFVSELFVNAAAALTDDELAGNKLTLITPQGIIFDNNDSSTSSRKIDTEIKIDNKVVNKDSSLLKYFWFKENYSINSSSLLYNRYGGNGWECLNNYNIVEKEGNTPTVIDWITNQSSYIIRKNNVLARATDYKCVVSYNNEIVLTKKFTIYNYSSNYIISIDSDSGTHFSYDNGHPTLTCSVNQEGSYTYSWGMIDSGNAFTAIQETSTTNAAYHTAANRYAELQSGLTNGTIVLTAEIQQEFNNLKYTLEQYNSIMRVEDNIIYNLKLNMINNFATFICLVYDSNNNYIGKGQIKIENNLNTSDSSYTLVINKGDQVFKYNGDGISPTSRSLENPQEIYPLSFTLYDERGNEISNDVINANNVSWIVPTNDTMIKVSGVHGNPSSRDDYAETATYTGYKTFTFEIPVLYTANKTRNTIQLKVKYKDKIVIANTELMFLKEGESGSNGTDFICRIAPNTIDGAIPPLYPIVTWNNNAEAGTTNPTINFTPRTSGVWFKTQLYHNGSEIFDGAVSGVTTENKNVTVKWEIMKNKYDTTHSDVSNFNVNSSTGVFTYNNLTGVLDNTLKDNPVNIVKCTLTYDGIDYVATMPIILVKVNNSGSAQYKVELVENTGFRYAMYTTDGRTPIYDNSNPFVLKVIQTVENNDQDISTNTLPAYAVNYVWSVKGLTYTNNWIAQQNLILDTLRSRNLQRNEIYYKPIDNFNGLCLNNALFCDIKRNNQTLATIHIPIHMYLNRYGNAAMNGWDGNHIAIDNDGGFILAPQVGAGKKEQDNSFTGVFMGSVKEAGSSEEEVGLFGYNSGARTLELNSKDGSAKFGQSGSGQIIIEPGEDRAVIKSGDYEMVLTSASGTYLAGNVYFRLIDGSYIELEPGVDYTNGSTISGGNVYVWSDGSGMEIDLNDPHIRFGKGNFRVDKNGNVYAKGYATIAELNAGEIDIPGVENFKVETTTDRVQIETDSSLYPIDTTFTKTISGKCLYKDSYVSGYTVQLVDANGNVITHNPAEDGIEITTSITGQTFTISFSGMSSRQITNAVNNYLFKFSYTPIGSNTQSTIKMLSANAIIIAEDGKGITSVEVRYQEGTSPTTPPSSEGGWSVNPPSVAQGHYLWTRMKTYYTEGNPDISYSVSYMGTDGSSGTSYYTYIRYSINSNGNPMVENPTSETKYIGTYSGTSSTVPAYTQFKWSKYTGENGAAGNGIASVSIKYQEGTSPTVAPTNPNNWSDNPPEVAQGNYLWTRTITTYDNNTSSTSYSVARMGEDGQTGETGPAGPPGRDGTSVTVKGSYNSLQDLKNAVIAGTITPVSGDGYVIGNDLYVYTNAAGGGGTLDGDWNNVGQFKGEDAKRCFIVASTEVFKSTNGGSTFTPTSITITPYLQAVEYSSWAYSTNGGSSFTTITGTVSGISINSTTKALTIQNSCSLFNTNSALVFKCSTNNADVYDTITIIKVQDGINGTSATNIVCGNEAQALVCDSNGNVISATTITIPFAGYIGNNRAACSVTYSTLPSGMTLTSNTAATTSADGSLVLQVAASANLGGESSGVINLTFSCNSRTFIKKFNWVKAIAGTNGTSPYNVILTNESQSIAGGTSAAIATTITTNVIGYMGTTQQNTNVGTITGLPTGMTATINNNNSQNTSITFNVTTSMTSKSGQITIPITVNSVVINKIFSYSLSLTGATGTAASFVDISATSQIFKSIDGGLTFSPDSIVLTPRFQSVSYSKWQYSTNGGSTWIDVTSGSNGLTISGNALTISKNCSLFTTEITSIVFKCLSNNSSIFDTVTIVKLYDVSEIEIGGRNHLYSTKTFNGWNLSSNYSIQNVLNDFTIIKATQSGLTTNNIASAYPFNRIPIGMVAGKNITFSVDVKITNYSEWDIKDPFILEYYSEDSRNSRIGWKDVSIQDTNLSYDAGTLENGEWTRVYYTRVIDSTGINYSSGKTFADVNYIGVRLTLFRNGEISFKAPKLEIGNYSTDWTPAPEDTQMSQQALYTTTSTSDSPTISAEWSPSITASSEYYIWQKFTYTYENGLSEETTPVCIYTPASQIDQTQTQYCIHDSATTAPGDSALWQDTRPVWVDSYYQQKFLWVRTEYRYTNPERYQYSIPYYDTTWENIGALNKSIIDSSKSINDAIYNGTVQIHDGYIDIVNNQSDNGIRFSNAGISFKLNGEYTSVWDIDGTFNADLIQVRKLNADSILSGTLTLKASNNATENGVFVLQNLGGNEVAKVDVNGLKVTAVDGSYVWLRTGEDDSTKKGIYLVDSNGNEFFRTDTSNGIVTVKKQVVEDYQQYFNSVRIISLANGGIGFVGI